MTAWALLCWLCGPVSAAWFHGGSAPVESPRALYEAGRYEQVVAELDGSPLERLRGNDQRLGFLYLGMAYEKLGRLDRAVGVYQLGTRLFPQDINLLTQLAQTLHHSGLEQQAEPVFDKILKIHPNNSSAHVGLAQIDYALGFYDRSAGHYEKALETTPDNAELWREYSELMLAARQLQPAELAAKRSLSLKEDAATRVDLARVQRAAGRLPDALATLSETLTAHPDRADARGARALWLLEAGRSAQALEDAELLLKSAEPSPLAYWVRARVHLEKDEYSAAVADLHQAAAAERVAPFCAAAARELIKQLGAR